MADGLFDPSRIYEALKNAGALPTWIQRLPFSSDTVGEYHSGSNTVTANLPTHSKPRSTLSHELTHAVQFNLLLSTADKIADKKWKDPKSVTKEEQQFLDTTEKLFGHHIGVMGLYNRQRSENLSKGQAAVVKSLYGDAPEAYDKYRTTPLELQAFGVGNMTEGGEHGSQKGSKYRPHLDPTMAQEFDILLSMYEALPKESQATFTKPSRKSEDIKKWDTPVDLYEDPFKPTIK